MSRILGPVAVLALALLLAAGDLQADENRLVAPTGDSVRWDGGLDDLARQVAHDLATVRADVATALDLREQPPAAEIVLVRGYDRMRDEARAQVPEWAVGVAIGSLHRIVIRSDLLDQGFGGGLRPTLRHEWVHLAWADAAGPARRAVPLWFEEGVAEAVGGGASLDLGAALDRAVSNGTLLSFDDLKSSFPADALAADLAYKQSRSFVRFLADEKGWGSIPRVLKGTESRSLAGDSDAFPTSVREVTGRGIGEWDAAWRLFAEDDARSRVHWLLRDVDLLVLVLAGLISVFAFFAIRRRRRREAEHLDDIPPPDLEAGGDENRGGNLT